MKASYLPDEYLGLSEETMIARIKRHKEKLGKDLVILGHHYQRQEIIDQSDFRGDSFALAKNAAESDARYIVFCGVEFMAESARLLARENQFVIHPDSSAGCPMADMADLQSVENAWSQIEKIYGDNDSLIPVTYINSDVELKYFCGLNGGIICTSSNAGKIFDWAFEQGERVFFFPDEHLGRNTSWAKGLKADAVVLYDPAKDLGGLSPEQLLKAKVILWQGFCHVHTHFTVEKIAQARLDNPGCKVIVHPECPRDVVEVADANGSTAYIIDYCRQAAAGSIILIGTEYNLCQRCQLENPDKTILALDRSICPNMWKISLNDLLWVLDNLGDVNVVHVEEELQKHASLALKRMLAVS
jgi:quinolinate synthase